jgi:RimJ/RimL family protein N-acetyltransferase
MENPADPVFHIVTDRTVGLIKAKLDGHRALVGYVIDEPFWGQGIATAALRQMVYLLRENSKIQRIWAACATDNPGSSAVLEKCGFIREGILRNWIVYPAQGPEPQDNFSYYLPNTI